MIELEQTYLEKLPKEFYSLSGPGKFPTPEVLISNTELIKKLNLPIDFDSEILALLSGKESQAFKSSYSQAYAGHQFGHFTMLGDGRAHVLGELKNEKNDRFDLQLKGSGRTMYSRGGDGLASVGPMLREYLISEAMHGLGVKTSRSLAVYKTGKTVLRENETEGAVLLRLVGSHIRVGTFQFAAQIGKVEKLLDYSIDRHFKDEISESDNKALKFLELVTQRQIDLILDWMSVGFIHGVMNTDNMLVCGETIDYGPCAFMDIFKPERVFSSIDRDGRYSYENQPRIAQWNLAKLAETLLPLIDSHENLAKEKAEEVIASFAENFERSWKIMILKKIGLFKLEASSLSLVYELLKLMEVHELDFTETFYSLILNLEGKNSYLSDLKDLTDVQAWMETWKSLIVDKVEALEAMKKMNPSFVPRNHLVEEALSDSVLKGSLTKFNKLVKIMQNPYIEPKPEHASFRFSKKNIHKGYQTFCGT